MISLDDLDTTPKEAYYGPGVTSSAHPNGENWRDAVIGAMDQELQPGDAALSPDLAHKLGITLGDTFKYKGQTLRYADHSYISPGKPNTNTVEVWVPHGADQKSVAQAFTNKAQPSGSIGGALNPTNFSISQDQPLASLADLNIDNPIGEEVPTDTGIPGLRSENLVPVGSQFTGQVDENGNIVGTNNDSGEEDKSAFIPPPSGGQPVSRSADGSLIKFDDGSILNLKDHSLTYHGPDGSQWMARDGAKPVNITPKRQIWTDPRYGIPMEYNKTTGQLTPINTSNESMPDIPANMSVEDALKQLNPIDRQYVMDVANYVKPAPANNARDKTALRLAPYIMKVNPDYKQENFDTIKKVEQAYQAPGPQFNNIITLNTAVNHLHELQLAADALKNGNTQKINHFVNYVKTETGDPSVVDFETAKNALSGELAGIFKRSGATDPEIANVKGSFDSSNSPAQLNGAIHMGVNLMKGRLIPLSEGYNSGTMGFGRKVTLIQPEAAKILTDMGYGKMVKDYSTAGGRASAAPQATPAPTSVSDQQALQEALRLQSSTDPDERAAAAKTLAILRTKGIVP